jgi:quinol monooxygenase YgiN
VSVTEATVKPDAASRAIFWRNIRAIEQTLPSQAGLLTYSMRQELFGDTAWTVTVWADEASLVRFVYGGRHDTAMKEAKDATASMRFARFQRDCAMGPPNWDEALAKLAESGRSY